MGMMLSGKLFSPPNSTQRMKCFGVYFFVKIVQAKRNIHTYIHAYIHICTYRIYIGIEIYTESVSLSIYINAKWQED